jgi:uncharacterized membrane protein
MRIASVGHVLFAATFIALGIQGLIPGNLAHTLSAVPKDIAWREVMVVLVYLRPFIYLACGLGLFWQRAAGAAWVLYAWFAPGWDRARLGFATGETGVRNARILYALALIAFGLSHFAYLGNTAPLVPAWLPWHVFWAYFTGSTYLLAAVAILIGVYARLATALSTLQMGLFTLLVWTPLMFAGTITAGQRGEFIVSWMLTAAAWVLTDSYRSVPWLAARRRTRAAGAAERAL